MDEKLETLVLAALDRGDVDAACTIALKGYGPQLLGYLMAVLRDENAAGDAFSELSIDLWKGLTGFRRECTIRTYSYKLAWHAALRVGRDSYSRRREHLGSDEISQLAARIRTETALHLKSEAKEGIAALREKLDHEERTLLILRVDRELAFSEVADILGIDDSAARKRFERTKEKLRKLAEKAGLLKTS